MDHSLITTTSTTTSPSPPHHNLSTDHHNHQLPLEITSIYPSSPVPTTASLPIITTTTTTTTINLSDSSSSLSNNNNNNNTIPVPFTPPIIATTSTSSIHHHNHHFPSSTTRSNPWISDYYPHSHYWSHYPNHLTSWNHSTTPVHLPMPTPHCHNYDIVDPYHHYGPPPLDHPIPRGLSLKHHFGITDYHPPSHHHSMTPYYRDDRYYFSQCGYHNSNNHVHSVNNHLLTLPYYSSYNSCSHLDDTFPLPRHHYHGYKPFHPNGTDWASVAYHDSIYTLPPPPLPPPPPPRSPHSSYGHPYSTRWGPYYSPSAVTTNRHRHSDRWSTDASLPKLHYPTTSIAPYVRVLPSYLMTPPASDRSISSISSNSATTSTSASTTLRWVPPVPLLSTHGPMTNNNDMDLCCTSATELNYFIPPHYNSGYGLTTSVPVSVPTLIQSSSTNLFTTATTNNATNTSITSFTTSDPTTPSTIRSRRYSESSSNIPPRTTSSSHTIPSSPVSVPVDIPSLRLPIRKIPGIPSVISLCTLTSALDDEDVGKKRDYMIFTRETYKEMLHSLRHPQEPLLPHITDRRRWKRLMHLLVEHPNQPTYRCLSWRNCPLWIVPLEEWDQLIWAHHRPSTIWPQQSLQHNNSSSNNNDSDNERDCKFTVSSLECYSIAKTARLLGRSYQTRRSRCGIFIEYIARILATCPWCGTITTSITTTNSGSSSSTSTTTTKATTSSIIHSVPVSI